MESATLRSLSDKTYEKRKTAALEIERLIREASAVNDVKKIHNVIGTLCEMALNPGASARSGAIMGLAGCSLALGSDIAEYLGAIVPPVLASFSDTDNKVRYFACESMYNVAKVAKGEILIYFNELFDVMSKLAADTDPAVKNGAELLDRMIKDIVTEQASTYVLATSLVSPPPSPRASTPPSIISGVDQSDKLSHSPERAFSLPRFIPLLRERIYVINPFTRTYLVSWLTVLDSVPELELVSFLPEFLDGLLRFLEDPTVDVRTATQNILADFLKEIREVAEVQKSREEEWKRRNEEGNHIHHSRRASQASEVLDQPQEEPGKHDVGDGNDRALESDEEGSYTDDGDEGEGSGAWVPGQGVDVDHAGIIEILLAHLPFPDEEIQSTCLRWIAEFLLFVQPTMVSFTPRLIPVILPSLAHHVASIREAAHATNFNLYKVIEFLPDPTALSSPTSPTSFAALSTAAGKQPEAPSSVTILRDRLLSASPTPPTIPFPSLNSTTASGISSASRLSPSSEKSGFPPKSDSIPNLTSQFEAMGDLTPDDTTSESRVRSQSSQSEPVSNEEDPIDYGATVNAITFQLVSEFEETRISALEWLLMLHAKAPKKILAKDHLPKTGPQSEHEASSFGIVLLLARLSDPSTKVLEYTLRLLTQISLASTDEEYFPTFMKYLLELFRFEDGLLEQRGSTIIRQLCLSLNTERIYRNFAEILEKDEDLEFASIMVQNLNLIMITSPELADFRRRLKSLESKDGQALFNVLYRSWSHNAVATFTLCLLAQAYEQACSLLQIFAELEITVSLLIQIDKLVQLLESPVFTSLRLHLIEPDRYPYLLKAMYGLLMLLPQSSAFVTLRNRLSAVSSLGFIQTIPKPFPAANTTRSTIRRDDIRWTELLTHFRTVQKRRASANIENIGSNSHQQAASSVTSGGTGSANGGSRIPSASAGTRRKLPVLGRSETGASNISSTTSGIRTPRGGARSASPTAVKKRLPSIVATKRA